MPSALPPDSWRIPAGSDAVWGTDIDRNETGSESGENAIEFLATTTGAGPIALESDTAMLVEPSGLYELRVRVNADINAGGDDIQISFQQYDEADVLIGAAIVISAPTVGVGAYETIGAVFRTVNNARRGRIRFGKSNTSLVNVFFDQVELKKIPDAGEYLIGAVLTVAGAWTPIPLILNPAFTSTRFTLGPGVGVVTVEDPGLYMVSGMLEFDGGFAAAAQAMAVRVTFTDVILGPTVKTLNMIEHGMFSLQNLGAAISSHYTFQQANGTILLEGRSSTAANSVGDQFQIAKIE